MKHKLSRLSQSLFLGSSIIVASMTSVSASNEFDGLKIAMYQPASTLASEFANAKLSPEKMLSMADKLHSTQMSETQEELEFALVYAAANKGLAEAQFRLANYYIESELIEADETEAGFWLEEAIEQGHEGAKFVYENLYVLSFDIGC